MVWPIQQLAGSDTAAGLYAGAADRRRHQMQMANIAGELDRPLAEIQADYEAWLERLGPEARIREFLPTIIGKKLRDQHRRVIALPELPVHDGRA